MRIWMTGVIVMAALSGCSALDPYADAKEAVRRLMKDPDSAQFRDVSRCSKPDAIWGEVNSKNSYGAYSGFERFIFADGEAVVWGDNMSSYDLERWQRAARKCYSDSVFNQSAGADHVELEADNMEVAADAAVDEVSNEASAE